MDTIDSLDLNTILLALILLAIVVQIYLSSSSRDRRSLRDHNDRLLRSLNDPDFDRELRRSVLLEAVVATRLDDEFERLGALDIEQIRAMLADEGYLSPNEQFARKLKGWFTRERAGAIGAELFKKVLGIVNKHFGLG